MLHVVQNWIFWGFPDSWEVAIHTPQKEAQWELSNPKTKQWTNYHPIIQCLSYYHNKSFLTYVIKASHSKKFSSDSGPLNKQKPLFNWIISQLVLFIYWFSLGISKRENHFWKNYHFSLKFLRNFSPLLYPSIQINLSFHKQKSTYMYHQI